MMNMAAVRHLLDAVDRVAQHQQIIVIQQGLCIVRIQLYHRVHQVAYGEISGELMVQGVDACPVVCPLEQIVRGDIKVIRQHDQCV